MPGDARAGQAGGYRLIATGFVDAVFGVHLHGTYLQLLAEGEEQLANVLPVLDLANQQWYAEGVELVAQRLQVAQPEIDLVWRVVVRLPLGRAQHIQGYGRAIGHGGVECRVIGSAQVIAQPVELGHVGDPCALPSSSRCCRLCRAASGPAARCRPGRSCRLAA